MSNDQSYNGWTNYETWNVKLWIDNEQGSQAYWLEKAQDAWENAEADEHISRRERARFNLADQLKEEYREAMDDMIEQAQQSCSVWTDLLGAALSKVNWDEIAENILSDLDLIAE